MDQLVSRNCGFETAAWNLDELNDTDILQFLFESVWSNQDCVLIHRQQAMVHSQSKRRLSGQGAYPQMLGGAQPCTCKARHSVTKETRWLKGATLWSLTSSFSQWPCSSVERLARHHKLQGTIPLLVQTNICLTFWKSPLSTVLYSTVCWNCRVVLLDVLSFCFTLERKCLSLIVQLLCCVVLGAIQTQPKILLGWNYKRK